MLTRLAHTIKGSAATCPAGGVCEAAGELERLAAAAEFEAAAEAVERLANQIRQFLAFVPEALEQVQRLTRPRTANATPVASEGKRSD